MALINTEKLPVAVIIGATSKWQSDGRNTLLAHGHAVEDSTLPTSVRWGVGGAIAQKFAKEGFFTVLTTRLSRFLKKLVSRAHLFIMPDIWRGVIYHRRKNFLNILMSKCLIPLSILPAVALSQYAKRYYQVCDAEAVAQYYSQTTQNLYEEQKEKLGNHCIIRG